MAIYTRRGDRGTTSLFGGKSTNSFEYKRGTRKDSPRIAALGTIDELNSQLGFAVSLLTCLAGDGKSRRARRDRAKGIVVNIQKDLFEIAAEVGTPPRVKSPFILIDGRTKELEKIIDGLEGSLPALANFIFPGGSTAGASLHVARSVCRRLEREVVHLYRREKVNPEILRYINRLSDCLFILVREVNSLQGEKEEVWKGK